MNFDRAPGFKVRSFVPEVAEADKLSADQVLKAVFGIFALEKCLPEVRLVMPVTPVVYPGMLDRDINKMFLRSARDWSHFSHTEHILVAGHHKEAGTEYQLSVQYLSTLLSTRTREVMVHSQVAANIAPDTAVWVADQVEQLSLSAVAIRVPAFHMPRMFLTQLAEFQRRNLQVVLLPWSSTANPFEVSPLTGPWEGEAHSQADLFPGELIRIYEYIKKRDIASLKELQRYVRWLYTDSPAAQKLSRFR
jgi:hypothetical protein